MTLNQQTLNQQMIQQHIIGRTILEIEGDRLEEAWQFQQEVSDLLQEKVFPAMEQLFHQLVDADEVVRLDQVILQIDPIDRRLLADEFVQNILANLHRTLSDRLSNRLPGEGGTDTPKSRSTSDWEVLLYFLEYGRLPWWCTAQDWQSWLVRWETVMQGEKNWQIPLRSLLENPAVRQRLIVQFPEAFRHQLVLQLQPTWATGLRLLHQANQLLQALSPGNTLSDRRKTHAWNLLLAVLNQTRSPYASFPADQWIQDWLVDLIQNGLTEGSASTGNIRFPNNSTAPQNQSVDSNRNDSINPPQHRASDRLANIQSIAYKRLRDAIALLPVTEQHPWREALARIILRFQGDHLSDPADPAPRITDANTRQLSSLDSIEAIDRRSGNASRQTGEFRQDSKENSVTPISGIGESSLSTEELASGLFISQAGLVILYPFLSPYFQQVGLLDGNSFRNHFAQQTAIYLLHYLGTGEADAPEYELVLPKLLCGWALDQPLVRPLELTDAALAEGEKLLQAVINYWDILKSTSSDGLREGFLRRPGKLTQIAEGNWQLQIEQGSIDLLLPYLPWGFNVVKLPWMETMLMVDWS